jgi:hypothetical protein
LFAELRTILNRRSKGAPGDPALPILSGAALDQEANALFDQELVEEARQRLEQALVLLRGELTPATSAQARAERRKARREVLDVMGMVPVDGDVAAEERRWRSEALWDLARALRALK